MVNKMIQELEAWRDTWFDATNPPPKEFNEILSRAKAAKEQGVARNCNNCSLHKTKYCPCGRFADPRCEVCSKYQTPPAPQDDGLREKILKVLLRNKGKDGDLPSDFEHGWDSCSNVVLAILYPTAPQASPVKEEGI